ncbi:MAG: sulfurtransferase TusA family protein [Candidatus Hydrothermarchaeales archaeon]
MKMSLKDKTPTETLDERGKICPYPLMDTRDKIKEMSKGELLEVLVDHPPAIENISSICRRLELEHEVVKEDDSWRIFIQK